MRILFGMLLSAAALAGAEIQGTVVDPSGAAIAGAQIWVVSRTGVVARAVSGAAGGFHLQAAGEDLKLVITAPGFATRRLDNANATAAAPRIELDIAPQVDAVEVVGSAIDTPASEQGGSVSVIPRQELVDRNEAFAAGLLRFVPSLAFSQTGWTGGLTGLYIRGGYPSSTLIQIDGVAVNAFGGNFNFAQVPAALLDHIEVIRGPQSAVYGPYANNGVVNFVTRPATEALSLEVLAEGGSHREWRFAISAAGTAAGFGLSASATRMDADGPVPNSDFRNEGLVLNATRRWRNQFFSFHGDFTAYTNGVAGPYGSDPRHTFTGIDLVSRDQHNVSGYRARWQADLAPRVRQELTGAFFLDNDGYTSAWGFNSNKDLRGQGESRTVVSVSRAYTLALGASFAREEVTNTYIADAAFSAFPVRRNDTAFYIENRFQFRDRLFVNAGVRGEMLRTGSLPTDGYARLAVAPHQVSSVNPKLAVAYARGATRLHASAGTGIRPPSGFDLAYTDNPRLKPERSTSFDAGVERSLWRRRVMLDATYFYNRYADLIVILGGSLSRLSRFQSDNLANSRAQGAEFSARLRPARWILVSASYTHLATEILALGGGPGLAPAPYRVGQELTRRPAHSGAFVAAFTRGRVTADVSAYWRGSTLDVEPSFGATAGLFRNPGYAHLGVNANYRVHRGLAVYGNLRNALNRRYEEVFGYPSPRLNFVTGVKWTL